MTHFKLLVIGLVTSLLDRTTAWAMPDENEPLTFTTLWTDSADDKLILLFLLFPEKRLWHFMQIVSKGSKGDNLHEMSKSIFWEK